LVRY